MPRLKLRTSSRWLVLCILPIFSMGCLAPPPQIRLPPPNASFQERARAYNDHRAVIIRQTVVYSNSGIRVQNRLRLNNGITIFNPWDLVDIVGERTRTAKAAHQYSTLKRKQRTMFWSGFGGAVAGSAIALAATYAQPSGGSGESTILQSPIFWTGLVVTAAASLTMVLAYPIFGVQANVAQRSAFRSYNNDLRIRLGLPSRYNDRFRDSYPSDPPPNEGAPPRQGNPPYDNPKQPPQDDFKDTSKPKEKK